MKRLGSSRGERKRGRWKCEVINWGDEKIKEIKRWEVDEDVR